MTRPEMRVTVGTQQWTTDSETLLGSTHPRVCVAPVGCLVGVVMTFIVCVLIAVRVKVKNTVIRAYDHMCRYARHQTEESLEWSFGKVRRRLPVGRIFRIRGAKYRTHSVMVARSMVEDSRTVVNNPRRSKEGKNANLRQDLDRSDNHT